MAEDEFEVPTEHLTEKIHEQARESTEGWLKMSALLSALFAVVAAISTLESAHFSNDAMIKQILASDQWNYYQAKGIKGMLAENEAMVLKELGKPTGDIEQKVQKYKAEQKDIQSKAEAFAAESKAELEKHEMLSRAVTLCQIAIAIVAIAVMTRRKHFVTASGVLGLASLFFLVRGLLMQ